MDRDVNAKNTNLYNRHANQHETRDKALESRSQGLAAPLKYFHNKIKRLMIQRFAGDTDRLLDLACGRGGDLRKWIDCQIKYVRGYDIADQEVIEARKRLEQLREEKPSYVGSFEADFKHTLDIGDKVWVADGAYDAVTCMFALHYFFRSESSARNAIGMAAANLKTGGFFFGVLPDGKNVQEAIGEGMKPKAFKCVKLAPRWKGLAKPFGSPYTCALTDTVTEGGDEGEGSFEYLVFQKVLIALAKPFDLHPVTDYNDFQLDDVLEPAQLSRDGSSLFRRFKSHFPGSDPSLMLASQLNTAFVFRKGVEVEPLAPPSAPPVAHVPLLSKEEEGGEEGPKRKRVTAAEIKPQYKTSSKFKRAR